MTGEARRIIRRIRRRYGLPSGPAAIYVLCFARTPLGHARHYLGFVGRHDSLEHRLTLHRNGAGSKLMRAVVRSGGDFELALSFRVPLGVARSVERRLKDNGSGIAICPLCAPDFRAQRARQRRGLRARTGR